VAARHLAAGALVLAVTVAAFVLARALIERDARRESERRVGVAAAQVQSRLEEATSLTGSLRQFMLDEAAMGVTNHDFASSALRWLLPAGLQAAAWAEQVRASDRATYEQRLGHAIATPDAPQGPVPRAAFYLPATLVTGFPPMQTRGIDLRQESGLVAAFERATNPGGAGATPIAARSDGTSGLFLVALAPNAVDGSLRPGAVVVFVSEATLRAAARNVPGLRIRAADGDRRGTVGDEFAVAGQEFSVAIRKQSPSGPSALLPWLILGVGIVLAALTAAFGVNAVRRARAQADLDRIFTLSSDVIAVADFEGRLMRVNPAAERVLGYTQEELLEKPYLDFVDPDDRQRTAVEAAALAAGSTTVSFENRYVRKDGSKRMLEWTVTPVVEDRLMYGVARDVTERRRTEIEQAALRRVATLVAEGVFGDALFDHVAHEVATVADVRVVSIERRDGDGHLTVVASLDNPAFPVGSRWSLERPSVGAAAVEADRPARIDDYSGLSNGAADATRVVSVNSAVGVPIDVDGRAWGAIVVYNTDGTPVPDGTESRLSDFTQLLATAIARSESRAALALLADEQAALRRVATLVARGVDPTGIFKAVTNEVGHLFGSEMVCVCRFAPDGSALVFAGVSTAMQNVIPIGTRWDLDERLASAAVLRTGHSARVDNFSDQDVAGDAGEALRSLGVISSLASPIVVQGHLWGVVTISSRGDPLPPDTEKRLEKFTELVATAVANAESQSELAASRRRIVAASDESRRRIERDLHDGVQQQLVLLGFELSTMQEALPVSDALQEHLTRLKGNVDSAREGLVEIARGIHPAILAHGGLAPALKALARRSVVPVELHAQIDGPVPDQMEVAAYYVAAEALTNVAKYARASMVRIDATTDGGTLTLVVRDDGVGGADPGKGSGLVGLRDRVEALGGTINVDSAAGSGTLLAVTLPIAAEPGQAVELRRRSQDRGSLSNPA